MLAAMRTCLYPMLLRRSSSVLTTSFTVLTSVSSGGIGVTFSSSFSFEESFDSDMVLLGCLKRSVSNREMNSTTKQISQIVDEGKF